MPVVLEASVGQLVPFCEVDIAPGITDMATGGGFWVFVLIFSHSPLGRDVPGFPSAEIGEVVNVVIPFFFTVSTHVSQRDMMFVERMV